MDQNQNETTLFFISYSIGIIIQPILTFLGIFGNAIAIIVLRKLLHNSRSRVFSLYTILISLSISDSLILLLNFIINFLGSCFEYTGFLILPFLYQGYLVVILWPLVMSFQMSSIYLTLLISYDRWRAICRPLNQLRTTYSYRFLIKVIISTFTFCIIYNIPRWFEFNVKKLIYNCSSTQQCNDTIYIYQFIKSQLANKQSYKYIYISLLYLIFLFLLPLFFISFTNFQLIKTIRKNRKQWSEISRLQRKEVSQTKVPLVIVVLFYLLGLPPCLINLLDAAKDYIPIISSNVKLWQALVLVSNMFVLINSSSNFIIYCLLGKKFRLALLRCLICGDNCFTRWMVKQRLLSSETFSIKNFDNSSFMSRSFYRYQSVIRAGDVAIIPSPNIADVVHNQHDNGNMEMNTINRWRSDDTE